MPLSPRSQELLGGEHRGVNMSDTIKNNDINNHKKHFLAIKYRYNMGSLDEDNDYFCDIELVAVKLFIVDRQQLRNLLNKAEEIVWNEETEEIANELLDDAYDRYYDEAVSKEEDVCPPSGRGICAEYWGGWYDRDPFEGEDEKEQHIEWLKKGEFELMELDEDIDYTGMVLEFHYVDDGTCGLCTCDSTETYVEGFFSKPKREVTWDMAIHSEKAKRFLDEVQGRTLKLKIWLDKGKELIRERMIELANNYGVENIKVYKYKSAYYVYVKLPKTLTFDEMKKLREYYLDEKWRIERDEDIYKATGIISLSNILYNAKMVEGEVKLLPKPMTWDEFIEELQSK